MMLLWFGMKFLQLLSGLLFVSNIRMLYLGFSDKTVELDKSDNQGTHLSVLSLRFISFLKLLFLTYPTISSTSRFSLLHDFFL